MPPVTVLAEPATRAPARTFRLVIPRGEPRPGRWRPLWWPLAVFAASRLVVMVGITPALIILRDPGNGPWPTLPPGMAILRLLSRWDGAWYLWVTHRGYPTGASLRAHLSDVAFFPLHPLLLWGVSSLTRMPLLVAGVVVTLFLAAASAVLMWQLAAHLAGPRVADRATILYCLFPGSFALSFVYAEPLMLVGSMACLLALLRRRWVLAGVAGMVATAARPNGCVIIVACVWAAAEAILRRRDWRALAAPLLAPLGAGAFFIYLWVRTGRLMSWFHSERVMWHDHVSLGGPVVHKLVSLLTHSRISLHSGGLNLLVDNIGLVAVIGFLLLLRSGRWPAPVTAYAVAAVLMPLTSAAVGPRPRMLLAAFPVAVVVASRLSRRSFVAVASASGLLLAAVCCVTAMSYAAVP